MVYGLARDGILDERAGRVLDCPQPMMGEQRDAPQLVTTCPPPKLTYNPSKFY